MPQEEQYNHRDMTYSAWHRRRSTGRYVGIESAQLLAMIDLDVCLYIEYDEEMKEPLALIETARDIGQSYKCATVTRNLAKRADLPAYVVFYTVSDDPNPANPIYGDISLFRVKRLWPSPESEWRSLSPKEYAEGLLKLRAWKTKEFDIGLFGLVDGL